MATSTNIHLKPEDVGIVNFGNQSEEAAAKITELLQENHKKHHGYFNERGFHNHIVHDSLSRYASGASVAELQRDYERNAIYQQSPKPVEERIIEDMSDPEKFQSFLGDPKYHPDFLAFFEKRIGEVGWEVVVKEVFFTGDEKGDDMLVRLFSGLLHPIIHLGYGIEFNQPAIIAEALALTAIHKNKEKTYYFGSEEAAKAAAATNTNSSSPKPTLIELLQEAKANKKIYTAATWDDFNKIEDGLLKRAREETLNWLGKWTVDREGGEEELEKRTVEMIQTSLYFTAGAMRAEKKLKFDFFLLHSVTASMLWPMLNKLSFLTLDQRARLLEWKVRTDLISYAARHCPDMRMSEVTNFVPSKPLTTAANGITNGTTNGTTNGKTNSKTTTTINSQWPAIFSSILNYKRDDGHMIKFVRAIKYAEMVSAPYEEAGEKWVVIKSKGEHGNMFEKIGGMVVEALPKGEGPGYVRGAGFDEAWEGIPDRDDEWDGLVVSLEQLRN